MRGSNSSVQAKATPQAKIGAVVVRIFCVRFNDIMRLIIEDTIFLLL